MAWRRANQGPHFDPNPPVAPARRSASLGQGQNLRNSMAPPKFPSFNQARGIVTASGINRSVGNFLRRIQRY